MTRFDLAFDLGFSTESEAFEAMAAFVATGVWKPGVEAVIPSQPARSQARSC